MLEIRQLETSAGEFQLRSVTLTAEAGSYGILLGPPGSGKSVLVETICGLRRATAGRVVIDGIDVTTQAPRDRLVGYVPQDYVLFPAQRVVDNITFGLRARGTSRREARGEVRWVTDLLGIGHLLERWPATLSGGEKQRVALARALAIRPHLLLLDEPVSALDEGLRERVCQDLRRFQRELGITTLHISHNIEEALAVSDWAAVMGDGRLLQCGPMRELLRRPDSEGVARFLRAENILSGSATPVSETEADVEFAGHRIRVSEACRGEVTFMIRPELIEVAELDGQVENALEAELIHVSDRGVYLRLVFDAGVSLVAYRGPHERVLELTPGRRYAVRFPPANVHVFPRSEE